MVIKASRIETGGSEVKVIKKVFAAVLLILFAASFSYSQDMNISGAAAAGGSTTFDSSIGEAPDIQKERKLFYSIDCSGLASERFSLTGKSAEKNREVSGAASDISYRHNMDIYNIPRSLVDSISYNFSNDRIKKSDKFILLDGDSSFSELFQMGAAFLTNLAVHEFGHEVVARHVGAEGSRLNFFEKESDTFFLGTSSVEKIDGESILPYAMGGEFFADLTFEHALRDYRMNPSAFNRSLLFYSGTDFLWYCFYAFYLSSGHPAYDPITISEETGISKDMLFSVALAKTLVNVYRIYSGQDKVIPYFMVDRNSASLNFMIPFDIGG